VKIPRALMEQILGHARSGYPFEVCGVLLGHNGEGVRQVDRVVPAANRERDAPRVRYEIAPEDLVRIQREGRDEGREILGYYHSHPDHPARPSETDRRIAAEGLSDGVVHVVVGVERGESASPTAGVFRDRVRAFEEEPLDIE
jgi:proteasome lid subunit RPN8/RPN11